MLGVVLACAKMAWAETGVLRAGFAVREITPPVGSEIPGFFKPLYSTGVHDPLYVVAGVLSDGQTHLALVGVDALCITRPTVEAIRRAVSEQTGIPGAHVLIGASHTHTGGPIRPSLDGTVDRAYMELVERQTVEAIAAAWAGRASVELGIGTGREETLSFNRRFLMRDGREVTHPGKPGSRHHHLIVRPAGPIDPDVGVLAVRDMGGAVRGIVVNFACHATVMGGTQTSADYIGAMRRHLQRRYGADVPVVFLLGTCGDITQVNNLSPERQSGPEYCEMFGRRLGEEVARTIEKLTWSATVPLSVHSVPLELTIREQPDIERERPSMGLGTGQEEFYARERELVARERREHPIVACEIQALRIGELGIVANGSEYFCEYGLRIKAASPLPRTWVVTLANEWLGYIPTANAFVAGGYEPRTRRGSKFSIDAGQKILEASVKALEDVRREK